MLICALTPLVLIRNVGARARWEKARTGMTYAESYHIDH